MRSVLKIDVSSRPGVVMLPELAAPLSNTEITEKAQRKGKKQKGGKELDYLCVTIYFSVTI